jgi:pantetheine-phosphate adenylyltransferase
MKTAIYPGTFDPPTLGHLNIIQRAASKFDKLIVAIGKNPSKGTTSFSLEERIYLLEIITGTIPNIEITSFDGILVDFAQSQKVEIVIRTIRTILDFEYETAQAQMNRQLGNIETFYLVADEKYRLISSTLVREIGSHGKRLTDFVPSEIEETVFHRLFRRANFSG